MTPAAALIRRRALARLLQMAAAAEPGADWGEMVGMAWLRGATGWPPGQRPDRAEIEDLFGVTFGELFDHGPVPPGELRTAAFGPATETPPEGT